MRFRAAIPKSGSQATEPGVYQVFCTEYCGKGHSDMLAKIYVDDEEQYQKWLVEGDEEIKNMPLPELGQMVWENRGCATCHSIDGTRGQGPSWKGIWGQMTTDAGRLADQGGRELYPRVDSRAASACR